MIAVTLDTYVNVLASSHINDKQGSVYHAMSELYTTAWQTKIINKTEFVRGYIGIIHVCLHF